MSNKLNFKILLILACLLKTNGLQQIAEEENDENFSQLAETMAAVSAAVGQNSQCERIGVGLCSSMPYNFTRMPNFFGDSSQIEAVSRSAQYETLARSTCSRHLLAYLCELLAPMCIENDQQKKFEIYPCRSYCRQVKRECENQILDMAARFKLYRIPQAFDCDSLRFEENGGDGPCHAREEGPQPSPGAPAPTFNAGNNYQPYQKDLDMNVPPFTDNTPIDKRIIRPSNHPAKTPPPATTTSTQNVSTQLQSLGHHLAAGLVSYSNLLSVLTLICLLLVVNAKRLRRVKNYLARRSSSSNWSSSSSSASSNDSRRKLAAVPALGQPRKLALSPSSSSRSLVLVTADGKRGHPKHKLVHANELASNPLEPSQKLLQAGLDRRTLINVNGTLERQKQQQNAARYQLLQSRGANGEANKHQYDYIQVLNPATGRAGVEFGQRPSFISQQPNNFRPAQVYSNILLSSPSHQVLLLGDSDLTAASLSSPYADPTFGGSMSSNWPVINERARLGERRAESLERYRRRDTDLAAARCPPSTETRPNNGH